MLDYNKLSTVQKRLDTTAQLIENFTNVVRKQGKASSRPKEAIQTLIASLEKTEEDLLSLKGRGTQEKPDVTPLKSVLTNALGVLKSHQNDDPELTVALRSLKELWVILETPTIGKSHSVRKAGGRDDNPIQRALDVTMLQVRIFTEKLNAEDNRYTHYDEDVKSLTRSIDQCREDLIDFMKEGQDVVLDIEPLEKILEEAILKINQRKTADPGNDLIIALNSIELLQQIITEMIEEGDISPIKERTKVNKDKQTR